MDLTTPPQNDSGYDSQETGPEDQLPALAPADAETLGFAPETVDLVSTLSDAEQEALATEVMRAFDRDWKGSEKFRARRTSIVKLFLGILPESDDASGDEGSARVHYPIIATAIQRMHSRIYDQQFPSTGEFFGVKPQDALDLERAIRVAKHLNWQVMHKIREYVMNHDVLIMQWLLYGSAFSYIYQDPVKNRPCHEVCRTEDIVLPYTFSSTDPSMSDVPRISRILRKYQHELDALQDDNYYQNVDKLVTSDTVSTGSSGSSTGMFNVSSSNGGGQSMNDVMQKAQGIEKPGDGADDPDAPRELVEQHRWWKFKGDKKQRPVVVTVDRKTKTLIGLRLREDEDPQDRARYNREKAANRASYDSAMQQFSMDMAMYQQHFGAQAQTMPPPGLEGPTTMTQPPAPGEMTPSMPVQPQLPPPPSPPQQPEEPLPPKMVAINFFTHYVCIPNPEGILGFGIGYLLEGHNMVADTIASQIVDAGTLANTSTFIYSRQAKMRRGEFRISPGMGNEVDLSPQDLDKGIKMLEFKGPDPQLAAFIKDQKQEADALSGANEILSGEVGGSNETATTTQIRISQALAAISILNKRYTRARTFEGQALARLNSVHLDDKEYFTVVDPFKTVPPQLAATAPAIQPTPPPQAGPPGMAPPGGPPGAPPPGAPPQPPMMPPGTSPVIVEHYIGRIDYLEDVDITVTADPRMASQIQRVQEAQSVMTAISSNPFTAQMPSLVMAGMKFLFTAMDRPEMVAALEQAAAMPPPAPPGQPPQGGVPPPKGAPGGNGPPQAPPGPAQNGPFMNQNT